MKKLNNYREMTNGYRECFAQGYFFFPEEFNIPYPTISRTIDYLQIAKLSDSAQWWIHSFQTLYHILAQTPTPPTKKEIEGSISILKDWTFQNPTFEPASPQAWNRHATALRANVFARLHVIGCRDYWFIAMCHEHGRQLYDLENYDGSWNHGFDQNLGLLALGVALNYQVWIDAAQERCLQCITYMVDDEGVTVEQAVNYQHYNYVQIRLYAFLLKQYNFTIPDILEKCLRLMPQVLAHMTMPSGRYINLGDTDVRMSHNIKGTEVEYILSKGKKGIPFTEKFQIYTGGYVFGRSGFGEKQDFENEAYYSLRFGPGRIIHGHNDHTALTYYTKGYNILNDGGFHGYIKDKYRSFFQSIQAHNVVFSTEYSKFNWMNETKLIQHEINDNWQNYTFEDEPYAKVKRFRHVYIDCKQDIIIVFDKIVQSENKEFIQAWHFESDFKFTSVGQHTKATNSHLTCHVFQMWPYMSIEAQLGEDDPVQGYLGVSHEQIEPAPVLYTRRKDKVITFLTIFVIQKPDIQNITVTQRPIKSKQVERSFGIKISEKAIVINLHTDNQLRPELV